MDSCVIKMTSPYLNSLISYCNSSLMICSVVFASSVLNLCELIALRPDLATSFKVYYFHENQLVYPVRKKQDRDFQHGYIQILSWYVYFSRQSAEFSTMINPWCR